MDCICPGFLRGFDDAIDAQVTLARWSGADRHRLICIDHVQRGTVSFRVDGDGWVSELPAGSHDPDRDLAAIRDQDFHRGAL